CARDHSGNYDFW
nr:immunoglobulin heavy chain junction region [Macaca mulatta]MOV48950.1 immunoglobulin heavy chain junction region [Macaca mulatta]MOV48961.1 immunoglobulin heavy chain junction region [Macaca mulatta]MOV49268.1 immunoglobulin heavy chain junction region [Macaca mulatta]MOV49553.1 immunoglobulin heavy chain junction region [Macaca mulatta]